MNTNTDEAVKLAKRFAEVASKMRARLGAAKVSQEDILRDPRGISYIAAQVRTGAIDPTEAEARVWHIALIAGIDGFKAIEVLWETIDSQETKRETELNIAHYADVVNSVIENGFRLKKSTDKIKPDVITANISAVTGKPVLSDGIIRIIWQSALNRQKASG